MIVLKCLIIGLCFTCSACGIELQNETKKLETEEINNVSSKEEKGNREGNGESYKVTMYENQYGKENSSVISIKYYKNNLLVKEYESNAPFKHYYTYIYDEEKKLIKREYRSREGEDDDFLESVTIYEYDANGNCILETESYESGRIESVQRKYDNAHNIVEEKEFVSSNAYCTIKYKYDGKNRLIEETCYDDKENQEKQTTYTYIDDEKVVKAKTIGVGLGEIKYTWNYNEDGQIVSMTSDSEVPTMGFTSFYSLSASQ